MNVLQIHSTDLDGRAFNGYDLQRELNKKGIISKQLVYSKSSTDRNVVLEEIPSFVQKRLEYEERVLSIDNLLAPWKYFINNTEEYRQAEIIHYHMIHHHLISLLDLPKEMNYKPSVWTIHDPWIVTGHCVHPLTCGKWKNICVNCEHIDWAFPLHFDRTVQQYKIKKSAYQNINPEIVVSTDFMKSYLLDSPLTRHFAQIHVIPFGVKQDCFSTGKKCREIEKLVIGFRVSDYEIKGCSYIYEMMWQLRDASQEIVYVCIGDGELPEDICMKFNVEHLGWCRKAEEINRFYEMCDIFCMPSLAESFGLMAIEAMAHECCVICFENTVLEEVIDAPKIGCAAGYADSKSMADIVRRLLINKDEIKWRGCQGKALVKKKYKFEDYVNAHIDLYKNLLKKQNSK